MVNLFVLNNNQNKINMNVLNKSIRVHSYFVYQYQTAAQAKSKENDANKMRKIVTCMILNKTMLMMQCIVQIPKHQRYKELNPWSTSLGLEVRVSFFEYKTLMFNQGKDSLQLV